MTATLPAVSERESKLNVVTGLDSIPEIKASVTRTFNGTRNKDDKVALKASGIRRDRKVPIVGSKNQLVLVGTGKQEKRTI